jgi:hypothetical protein
MITNNINETQECVMTLSKMSEMLETRLKIIDKKYTVNDFPKPVLTRYLYLYDEVAISYIHALLSKNGNGNGNGNDREQHKESYYWISEMYYSGFVEDTWRLLWFIYYDFYYIHNPHFEPFLFKKHKIGDLKSMMTVTKNLGKMTSSHEVFVLRQYTSQPDKSPDDIVTFRGKKPEWIKAYPEKFHKLIRSLHRKLYKQVSTLITEHHVIDDDFIQCLKLYYANDSQHKLPYLDEIIDNQHLLHEQYNIAYDNIQQKILAFVCLCEFNSTFDYNSKKKVFISATNTEMTFVRDIHENDIPLNKYGNPQKYKTLEYKRHYAISPYISHFHLSRWNRNNIHDDVTKRWEYFAYYCPLWKERFDANDITILENGEKYDNNEKIVFNDDDELEKFYEKYGYEPDEQSSDVHNKGIPDINIEKIFTPGTNNLTIWCNAIFKCKPIIELKNDNYFVY